jgi:hypothetical protein
MQVGSPTQDCDDLGDPAYCAGSGTFFWTNNPSQTKGIFAGTGAVATRIANITDGSSNTLLLCERKGDKSTQIGIFSHVQGAGMSWKINTKATVGQDRHTAAGSYHVGGAHFLLADGAVRFISENIGLDTYCYLGGRAEGQPVGDY